MDPTLEVLTEDGGCRRNRKWPYAGNARFVAETLRPGATVAAVARRHGVKANHLSAWRTLTRQGKLVLPAPEHEVERGGSGDLSSRDKWIFRATAA